jgi:hypothetical protein
LTQSLNPGGAFILESKVEPGATAMDRYPGVGVLCGEIGQMRVIHSREEERVLNEGRYHQGSQRTAQIWAQRD